MVGVEKVENLNCRELDKYIMFDCQCFCVYTVGYTIHNGRSND